MPAKKKSPPQSSNAAEKRASGKKSPAKKSGPQWGTGRPTAAITKKGQKATGSFPKNATGMREPKTKAHKADAGLRGFGTPTGTSFAISQPTKASNVANAALMITLVPGKGKIASAVAGRIARLADDSAFGAASKGLSRATGAGGRVSRTFTPMGPALRSTRIGTAKQQSARISNLLANAERIGAEAGASAYRSVTKSLSRAGYAARTATAAGLTANATKKKRSNKR